MSRDALPPPSQMGNGGPPPAHLSLSSLSDPSWWLQFKWSQPPPRAPEWLFDTYNHYNPLTLPHEQWILPYKEWIPRAIREDKQSAGLLPPKGGGPLHKACARADRAYRDWKMAVNKLWADEHHRLCLVAEQASRACQEEEAARYRQLLNEQAARARQAEAARARQAEAARARQEEDARQEEAAR